jgi:hypothetical protein
MKNKPYKRKPGDFEIRILKNGRVVMITPDEALLEVAEIIEPNSSVPPAKNGDKGKCRNLNQ